MTLVWSYGGGVQTAAIAVLIREGALPRPDITIMADTGREATATWDYLRDVIAPYLAPVGVCDCGESAWSPVLAVDDWGGQAEPVGPDCSECGGVMECVPATADVPPAGWDEIG